MMRAAPRDGFAAVLLLSVVLVVLGGSAPGVAAPAGKPKVVVIGFDGADPKLVEEYRSRGLMPNLDHIAQGGAYGPLWPTNPPQTPVSWAAFATGLNPGRTEIFDFLQREKGAYEPDFALARRSKRPFLYGEANAWVIPLSLAVLLGGLVLIVLRVAGTRWRSAGLAGAALCAVVAALLIWVVGLGRLLPAELPDAVNNRKGTPFWTIAAQHGMKVRVTRVPVTFPAERLPAGSTMLSGLGVPDMRGRIGAPSYFTSDRRFTPGVNEFSLELTVLPARRGAVETRIVGPTDYPFHQYVLERARDRWAADGLPPDEIRQREKDLEARLDREGYPKRVDLPLKLDIGDRELRWEVSGQKGALRPGEWSDWVVLDFPINWLVDRLQPLRGMARFKLIALEPEVQLYVSPVNFHPSCHPIAFSWPPNWADKLAGQVGLFKTIGWKVDTWSYPSGVGGVDLFLEDMWFTVDADEKIMERALGEPGADVVVQIFEFTDRAGHMLWHELDEKHPLYDPRLAGKYHQAMEQAYRRMDQLIGKAHELAGPDALFVVLSDHGFSSFRRQINYNTWLFRHGLLALKEKPRTRDLEQLFDKDVTGVTVFQGINWSATRAWAMGLGSIYINVVGREPHGVVMPGADYDAVVSQIKTGLEAEVDPATGERPVQRVYRRDELYHDYDPNQIPDLRAANIENYRISWQDTLGGLSTQIFEDNTRAWSGDHCSLAPQFVRGILLVNRKLKQPDPAITDIAPSILAELGLPPDATLDGRVIWAPGGR